MIPLSLIVGFLGSGKTTFLKRVIAKHRARRIVYLVNEFAATDIDGRVLAAEGGAVTPIPGGSIFCRCLAGRFVEQLRAAATGFDPAGAPVEGVVVEASGIADPSAARDLLAETKLDAIYRFAPPVAVVEPVSLLKLYPALPGIRGQVATAGTILLNKIDVAPPGATDEAEALLRKENPRARILRTVRADADVDLFAADAAPEIHGELAKCADPYYDRFEIAPARPVDPETLRAALDGFRETLYRAKGFVPTPGGPAFVDWTPLGVRIDPATPDAPPGFACVARSGAGGKIRRALAALLEDAPPGDES